VNLSTGDERKLIKHPDLVAIRWLRPVTLGRAAAPQGCESSYTTQSAPRRLRSAVLLEADSVTPLQLMMRYELKV
jgi:hypothetical protein